MTRLTLLLAALLLSAGCEKKKDEARPSPPPPARFEPLQREAGPRLDGGADEDSLYQVVPLPPVGPPVPEGTHLTLEGEVATAGGQPFELTKVEGPLILEPTEDTYLVQASGLFAQLDDGKREVWLRHPDAPIAFKVTLRDEASFQAWVDEAVPGKLRIIHRADGFELQTNMGKLPGGDPNGPTVPVRGGKFDLKTLQRGLERIHSRFKTAPDLCIVPSFGMELSQVARAMAADYTNSTDAFFPELCLVYARPTRDAGK